MVLGLSRINLIIVITIITVIIAVVIVILDRSICIVTAIVRLVLCYHYSGSRDGRVVPETGVYIIEQL